MNDNPYQPPSESDKQPGEKARSGLDKNTKELLGIAKEDFWAHPGIVLLVIACFLRAHPSSRPCLPLPRYL